MAQINRVGLSIFSLAVVVLLSVATSAPLPSLSLPSLVPAFVWSNSQDLNPKSDSHLSTSISYQTFSAEDFVKKVKDDVLGPVIESAQKELDDAVDVLVVFIGKNLKSGDVSRDAGGTRAGALQRVLNRVVSSANSSWSGPYVASPRDGSSVKDVLLREIVGDVEDSKSRVKNVIIAESCGIKSGAESLNFDALEDRVKTRAAGTTDLMILCGGSETKSEGEVLEQFLGVLDEMNLRYVALYTTDLSAEKVSASRPRGRQLGSVVFEGEEYCNEVCQAKATLLEGLLVAFTLLIILISGLCCMSGIASPVRFETSKGGQ